MHFIPNSSSTKDNYLETHFRQDGVAYLAFFLAPLLQLEKWRRAEVHQ